MDRVAIIGTSMTDFGRRDAWLRELLVEAGRKALSDAGIEGRNVEHLYVANMAGGEFEGATGLSNALAHDLNAVPAYTQRIDQTSASGGAGLFAAWQSVASGASDVTLLVGGEKMTHLSTAEATDVISSVTHPFEYKHGVTLPGFAAMTARAYFDAFDAPRESLAAVAVKNHENGIDNPHAQFKKRVDRETVMESPVVADPLRLYDFCPITDGSAAAVLTNESLAEELGVEYVTVAGIGGSTDTHVVHQRDDLTRMNGVVHAGNQAFEMAHLNSDDIDVAELHDMSTILEVLQFEALGFSETGMGWKAAIDGVTERSGSLPVNPSGGLKAKGHPLGASGVAQVHELATQLLGEANDRQVNATTGIASAIGGFGNCVTVTILERGGERLEQTSSDRSDVAARAPKRTTETGGRSGLRDAGESGTDGDPKRVLTDQSSTDPSGFHATHCENGHVFVPTHPVCPTCGSADLDVIDLSGETGTVRTWTTIETSAPGVREPNTLAIVDFAIGGTTVRTLGQVTTDAVGIGTEVRPTFVSELRDPDPSFRRTDSQSWGGHRFEPVE